MPVVLFPPTESAMPAGNMKELRGVKREAKLGLLNESRGIGMFEPVTVTFDGHASIS